MFQMDSECRKYFTIIFLLVTDKNLANLGIK